MGRPHYTTTAELNVWMEKRIRELEERASKLQRIATRRRKAIEVAMRYCDRETFDVLQEALEGE